MLSASALCGIFPHPKGAPLATTLRIRVAASVRIGQFFIQSSWFIEEQLVSIARIEERIAGFHVLSRPFKSVAKQNELASSRSCMDAFKRPDSQLPHWDQIVRLTRLSQT
jgi:hypothetical protein